MNVYTEVRVNDMFDRIAKGVEGYADVSGMGFVPLWRESSNLSVRRRYLVFTDSCRLMVMVSMDANLFEEHTKLSFSVSPLDRNYEMESVMNKDMSGSDYDASFMDGAYQGIHDFIRNMVYGDRILGDGQVRWVDDAR